MRLSPPIKIKASVLRLRPFVFSDIQHKIHPKKFSGVKFNIAVKSFYFSACFFLICSVTVWDNIVKINRKQMGLHPTNGLLAKSENDALSFLKLRLQMLEAGVRLNHYEMLLYEMLL